jgi:hypothetical protein
MASTQPKRKSTKSKKGRASQPKRARRAIRRKLGCLSRSAAADRSARGLLSRGKEKG